MQNKYATWPNLITTIRLILIPFFLIALLNNQKMISVALFLIMWISDKIDGFVARRFNQVTRIGSIYDPIVDNLLMILALITFVMMGKINLFYFTLLIAPGAFMFVYKGIKIMTVAAKERKIKRKENVYEKIRGVTIFLIIFIGLIKQTIVLETIIIAIINYAVFILEIPLLKKYPK